MSFVSIIANENLCCIMSDGRLTNRTTGEIEQEDLPKFDCFNYNTTFIATTGTKGFADYILNNIGIESNNYEELIKSLEGFYSDPKLNMILKFHPHSTLQFTFGGLNHNNEIEVYSFNYKERTIKKHRIPSDDNLLLMLGEEKYFDGAFEVYKKEMEGRQHFTASDYIGIQKLMNNYVADSTSHVNEHFALI